MASEPDDLARCGLRRAQEQPPGPVLSDRTPPSLCIESTLAMTIHEPPTPACLARWRACRTEWWARASQPGRGRGSWNQASPGARERARAVAPPPASLGAPGLAGATPANPPPSGSSIKTPCHAPLAPLSFPPHSLVRANTRSLALPPTCQSALSRSPPSAYTQPANVRHSPPLFPLRRVTPSPLRARPRWLRQPTARAG